MVSTVDTVVFGAGPAGLAAALLSSYEGHRVALLELGASVTNRGRHVPTDLVTGVGGAGLYSDGKFSFYPSASELWHLQDREDLRAGYIWLSEVLSEFTSVPPFPTDEELCATFSYSEPLGKSYESRFIDFDARVELIKRLSRALKGALVTHATVEELIPRDDELAVRYHQGGRQRSMRARTAIIACGRFGGLELASVAPWMPAVFRRYEVGIRLEAVSGSFFLQNHPNLDPKYIIPGTGDLEWRTFCTCRNGEVVETDFRGLVSYSGRSDVAHTRFSNVGFNVRLLENPPSGSELAEELQRLLRGEVLPFRLGLEQFMSPTVQAYGPALDALLRKGLHQLPPDAMKDVVVTGPCLEGLGHYPAIDGNLRISDVPIWIAGDQTGIFRGLTAAFISGHYAARQAHEHLTRLSLRYR